MTSSFGISPPSKKRGVGLVVWLKVLIVGVVLIGGMEIFGKLIKGGWSKVGGLENELNGK